MWCRRLAIVWLAIAVSIAIGTGLSVAKDANRGASGNSTDKKEEVKGRLPIYFGQIGLSKKQEDEVRKTAQPFDVKIQGLRKEISELESQIDQLDKEKVLSCEAVLTDNQKAALKARREQAELEKAARKKNPKAAEAATTSDSNPKK